MSGKRQLSQPKLAASAAKPEKTAHQLPPTAAAPTAKRVRRSGKAHGTGADAVRTGSAPPDAAAALLGPEQLQACTACRGPGAAAVAGSSAAHATPYSACEADMTSSLNNAWCQAGGSEQLHQQQQAERLPEQQATVGQSLWVEVGPLKAWFLGTVLAVEGNLHTVGFKEGPCRRLDLADLHWRPHHSANAASAASRLPSTAAAAAQAASAGVSAGALHLLNKRLLVWKHQGEAQPSEAQVLAYDDRTGLHTLQFDGGEFGPERLNLASLKWQQELQLPAGPSAAAAAAGTGQQQPAGAGNIAAAADAPASAAVMATDGGGPAGRAHVDLGQQLHVHQQQQEHDQQRAEVKQPSSSPQRFADATATARVRKRKGNPAARSRRETRQKVAAGQGHAKAAEGMGPLHLDEQQLNDYVAAGQSEQQNEQPQQPQQQGRNQPEQLEQQLLQAEPQPQRQHAEQVQLPTDVRHRSGQSMPRTQERSATRAPAKASRPKRSQGRPVQTTPSGADAAVEASGAVSGGQAAVQHAKRATHSSVQSQAQAAPAARPQGGNWAAAPPSQQQRQLRTPALEVPVPQFLAVEKAPAGWKADAAGGAGATLASAFPASPHAAGNAPQASEEQQEDQQQRPVQQAQQQQEPEPKPKPVRAQKQRKSAGRPAPVSDPAAPAGEDSPGPAANVDATPLRPVTRAAARADASPNGKRAAGAVAADQGRHHASTAAKRATRSSSAREHAEVLQAAQAQAAGRESQSDAPAAGIPPGLPAADAPGAARATLAAATPKSAHAAETAQQEGMPQHQQHAHQHQLRQQQQQKKKKKLQPQPVQKSPRVRQLRKSAARLAAASNLPAAVVAQAPGPELHTDKRRVRAAAQAETPPAAGANAAAAVAAGHGCKQSPSAAKRATREAVRARRKVPVPAAARKDALSAEQLDSQQQQQQQPSIMLTAEVAVTTLAAAFPVSSHAAEPARQEPQQQQQQACHLHLDQTPAPQQQQQQQSEPLPKSIQAGRQRQTAARPAAASNTPEGSQAHVVHAAKRVTRAAGHGQATSTAGANAAGTNAAGVNAAGAVAASQQAPCATKRATHNCAPQQAQVQVELQAAKPDTQQRQQPLHSPADQADLYPGVAVEEQPSAALHGAAADVAANASEAAEPALAAASARAAEPVQAANAAELLQKELPVLEQPSVGAGAPPGDEFKEPAASPSPDLTAAATTATTAAAATTTAAAAPQAASGGRRPSARGAAAANAPATGVTAEIASAEEDRRQVAAADVPPAAATVTASYGSAASGGVAEQQQQQLQHKANPSVGLAPHPQHIGTTDVAAADTATAAAAAAAIDSGRPQRRTQSSVRLTAPGEEQQPLSRQPSSSNNQQRAAQPRTVAGADMSAGAPQAMGPTGVPPAAAVRQAVAAANVPRLPAGKGQIRVEHFAMALDVQLEDFAVGDPVSYHAGELGNTGILRLFGQVPRGNGVQWQQLSRPCHDCQQEHVPRCCSHPGCNADSSTCNRCLLTRYKGLYSVDELLQACPLCRGVCACDSCLRSADHMQLAPPLQFSAEQRCRQAAYVLAELQPHLIELMQQQEAEAIAWGYAGLQQVAHSPLEELVRLLCDRCATQIAGLAAHCPQCGWDLCCSCAADLRQHAEKAAAASAATGSIPMPAAKSAAAATRGRNSRHTAVRCCNPDCVIQGLRYDAAGLLLDGFPTGAPPGEEEQQEGQSMQPQQEDEQAEGTEDTVAAEPEDEQGPVAASRHQQTEEKGSMQGLQLQEQQHQGEHPGGIKGVRKERFSLPGNPELELKLMLQPDLLESFPELMRLAKVPESLVPPLQQRQHQQPLQLSDCPLLSPAELAAGLPCGPSGHTLSLQQLQSGSWWQQLPQKLRDVWRRHAGAGYLFTPHITELHGEGGTSVLARLLFWARWRLGEPVIVRGIKGAVPWDPHTLDRAMRGGSKAREDRRLTVLDCYNFKTVSIPQSTFFKGYMEGHVVSRQQGDVQVFEPVMYKLKDYPPSDELKHKLQRHYGDFLHQLPLRCYTDPRLGTAPLNLATALQEDDNPTDLGPKCYIANGRVTEARGEGDSVTKCHVDMTDAVNLLMDVAPGGDAETQRIAAEVQAAAAAGAAAGALSQQVVRCGDQQAVLPGYGGGGAVWDIFSRAALQPLNEYLRDNTADFVHEGKQLSAATDPLVQIDPVMTQAFMMAQRHRDTFLQQQQQQQQQQRGQGQSQHAQQQQEQQCGGGQQQQQQQQQVPAVQLWHFEQYLGEAVFIPGGCAHQVRNLMSCCKIAVDFVSPESLGEALKQKARLREADLAVAQDLQQPPHLRRCQEKLQSQLMLLRGALQAARTLQEHNQQHMC